ncbi:MAG: phosphate signaling complex protein PhoU [Clostridia bacterium]|nr:phosphate signaling complex protein PhoU [Clostridia bacterium]
MRLKFDEQLEKLNNELIRMGALCENAIAASAKALLEGDHTLASEVPALSAQIDQKERDIEGMCLKLLLQQQPVARDLRVISAALKMITDMERIGDQSEDIAEIINMANIGATDNIFCIHDMAMATIKMVTDSIDAFVKRDTALAEEVIHYDDVVDDYFDRVKNLLIELLRSAGTDGEYALDLLMIAKYFERIGDHATNIAEWVIFSITGARKDEIT